MYIYANFNKINSNSIKIPSRNLKMDIILKYANELYLFIWKIILDV